MRTKKLNKYLAHTRLTKTQYTQLHMAELLLVSKQFISSIERGMTPVPLKMLRRFSVLYRVKISLLAKLAKEDYADEVDSIIGLGRYNRVRRRT